MKITTSVEGEFRQSLAEAVHHSVRSRLVALADFLVDRRIWREFNFFSLSTLSPFEEQFRSERALGLPRHWQVRSCPGDCEKKTR